MHYRIEGDSLPVLLVDLERGETIQCESGAMSWMDDEIQMNTEAGGLGKMFGRAFTGESMFMNNYMAVSPGEIAFASKFPGSIRAIEITPDKPIVVQKGAYLATFGDVQSEVFFQKKFTTGFFGGEGFLMRRFHGQGLLFLEVDGSAIEYDIPAGDCKIVDTGYLAAMDATCSMEVRTVKGIKNIFLGGEGLFNTVVKGPGHIICQSMPISKTATMMYSHMPHASK
ncbi:MAG TPA: TIGR00266 family protein [Eubacterium sp.]|nr:TIGR00266 family protein [Eubacterium sp.]HBZ53114.1 TIGR00266 family protein [Eubacterium sp.]